MSPPLSAADAAFVRAVLNNPAELTAWLVYADWLDEHDDPRGRFIRLEVRRHDPDLTEAERYWVTGELGNLRPTLDPDWVAVFDRPPIENCDELFAFRCPKKWEALRGTDDPGVRHCDACGKAVHYCRDLWEAYGHARRGACVAVAGGVARHPGDLGHDPTAPRVLEMIGLLRMPEPPPRRRPWWKFW
ncbi:MAG: hypothetical protein C0501_02770 [Isosphaera sp.]|nr:hypothetical protein [Isosphaera sp.]